MTDRVIVYPGSGSQDTDLLRSQVYMRRALHYLARMVLSPQANGGIVWNFIPQSVNGYAVTFSDGGVFGPNIAEDAAAFGSLDPALFGNTPVAVKPDTTTLTFSGPSSTANSVVHVVYATTGQLDTDDEVLYYRNASNPDQVFRGTNNNGQSQPTTRKDVVTLNIAVGTEAGTGTQTAPGIPVGGIPMYSVLVNGGDNAINLANITEHPASPFYPGFEQIWGGNPNGYVAGINSKAAMPPSMCYDYVNNIHYTCTQSGTAATAVWTAPAVNTGPMGAPGVGVVGFDVRSGNQLYATYTNGVVQDCGTLPPGPQGLPGAAGPAGLYSGTLIASTVFTPDNGGIFVPTINTNRLRITCVGSGGAGGGSIINSYSGGGGGSGATCIVELDLNDGLAGISVNRSSLTCYPGRGGIVGQVGLSGYTGSDSVITASGVELIRAHSGSGGLGRLGAQGPAGGAGGIAVINSGPYPAGMSMLLGRIVLALDGGDGADGQANPINGITQFGGNGGAGTLGGAGRAGSGSGVAGRRGTGGGGGGSYASTASGGAGGDGIIIIDEYH